jgi:ketopantoate reductase
VEAINGSIVQVARSQSLPAPYNQAMEYLINSLSERGKIKDFSSGKGKEV